MNSERINLEENIIALLHEQEVTKMSIAVCADRLNIPAPILLSRLKFLQKIKRTYLRASGTGAIVSFIELTDTPTSYE